MQEITSIEELKKIELDIMEAIHEFCQAKGISYFLWGGSLLGAIRHGGFIPWDDDIDIAMSRKDYDAFVDSFKHEKYKVNTCDKDKNYIMAHAKVYDTETVMQEEMAGPKGYEIGVYVDIFPIDNWNDEIPSKYASRTAAINKRHTVTRRYKKVDSPTILVRNIGKFLYRLTHRSANYYSRVLNESAVYGPSDKYVLYTDANTKIPLPLKKEWVDDVKLAKFEDKEFYIPKDADGLLTLIYGNYMQLPPVEKQVTHHEYKAYYRGGK